jgi:hypothetical protein
MRATKPRTVAENDCGRELRSWSPGRWNHEVSNASRFTSLIRRDHPDKPRMVAYTHRWRPRSRSEFAILVQIRQINMARWIYQRPIGCSDSTELIVAKRMTLLLDDWVIRWGFYYDSDREGSIET